MGGLRSTSLSGSNDGNLKLPVLSYILILLHVYMYVVVGVSIRTDDGLNLTAVQKVYLVNTTIRINCSLNDSNQRTNATDFMWTFDGEVVNATTPQLVIERAQFEDSGVYECKVGGPTQEEDIRWDVKVGLPPTKATDIRCDSYDFRLLNCSWENGRSTNIETTHVLQYSKNYYFDEGNTHYCQRNQKCGSKPLLNNFYVRVNSSNALAVDGVQSERTSFDTKDIMTITPIRSPSITNATRTSLQVSWLPSEEYSRYAYVRRKYTCYSVKYQLENMQQGKHDELQCHDNNLNITGLKANSVYTIGITVKYSLYNLQSKEIMLRGKTKEIAPEAGVNLKLLCPRIEDTNEALLSWTPFPEDKSNGKILSYDITKNSSVIRKDPNVTEHRLQGVDLYSDYNITIVARNSAGSSDIDECYIPALPHADPSAVVSKVLIILGAVLFIIIFILAFKFYICFKKSRITEIKLPHHIQHDHFNLFGGPQRRAPCEQERYDELITQKLVEEGTTLCNSTIPNGKKDPSREPIMPEAIKTEVSTA